LNRQQDSSTLNINTQKAMSSNNLSLVDYPPMGNLAGHVSVHNQTTSPIQSFKQLFNMVSPLYEGDFNSALDISLDAISNISATPTGGNPVIRYNFLLFILSIFRYWRGSTRVVLFKKGAFGDNNVKSWIHYDTPPNYVLQFITSPTSWWPIDQISQGLTLSPDVAFTPVDITIPFNCIYEKKLTALPLRNTVDPHTQVLTLWPDVAVTDGVLIGLAGGDDFCAGYLLPPPNCGIPAGP